MDALQTQINEYLSDLDRKIGEITYGSYDLRNRRVFEYLMVNEPCRTTYGFSLFDLWYGGLIPEKIFPVIDDYYKGDWSYIHHDAFLIEPSPLPVKGFVYLVKLENGLYKIGKTKHLSERMKVFAVSFPMKWELYYSFLSDDYTRAEKTLHTEFADKREVGEWFRLTQRDINSITAIKDGQL